MFAPVDAAWLAMEDPTNLMMVTGVLMLDGRVDRGRLRAVLEERLLAFSRFRERVLAPPFGVGLPQWAGDDRFDLDAHLHHIALPEPADQPALEALVSDLLSTPLDLTTSPWQIHIVDHGPDTVLVARLHHCIADGIGLIRVLLSLTDPSARSRQGTADGDRPAATDPWVRAGSWLAGMGGELVRDPAGQALAAAGLGLGAAGTLAQLALLPDDPPTSIKGPLGVSKRAAWSAPLDLAAVKQAGRRHGTTINDVLLSAAAGALRRYLAGRGDAVEGLEVRAAVPVNLRGPDRMHQLGNRFGLVFLALPLGIDDPLRRLRELHLRTSELKSSLQPAVAFGVLHAIGLLPGPVRDRTIDFFGSKASTVMTNVPGPQQPLYLAGRPLRRVMFWVPQSGRLGLGLSILSYAGEVMIGVAADAGLVPDPGHIVAAFEDELGLLLAREQAPPHGRGRRTD
jgi:WS/DGAT/MGAT family acyltransferase